MYNCMSDDENVSAVLHFVSTKDEEAFKSILSRISKDYNINAAYKGRALLHFMSEQGKENLVKYLLEFGADVNVNDKDGKTPLFYAVKESKPRIVRTLLNYGANIHDNQFPLEIFFKPFNLPSHIEILKMLLEAGYDVSPENKGMLPISKIFDEDTLDFIGSDSDDYKGASQNWGIVKVLCAHGAEICLKNEIGTEILHSFCAGGRLDDVRFSVKHGADLFSIRNGQTTLHKAVFANNIDLVDYLLRHGLDINAKNKDGNTPLVAIFSDLRYFMEENSELVPGTVLKDRNKVEKKCVELMEFLVDNGANVNAFHNNHIYIDKCIFGNLLELIEYFLQLKGNIDFQDDVPLFCARPSSFPQKGGHFTRIVPFELLTAFLAMKINDISSCIYNPEELDWIGPFFEKCKTEVKKMKKRNIHHDRNISFFDFLSQDLREVAIIFCRSEEIMHVLESGEYKKEFPSYKYLLRKRFARVQLLRNSINLLSHFLEKVFDRKLPIVILDTILSFLGAGDLRNFARALRISKDFPNGKY